MKLIFKYVIFNVKIKYVFKGIGSNLIKLDKDY